MTSQTVALGLTWDVSTPVMPARFVFDERVLLSPFQSIAETMSSVDLWSMTPRRVSEAEVRGAFPAFWAVSRIAFDWLSADLEVEQRQAIPQLEATFADPAIFVQRD